MFFKPKHVLLGVIGTLLITGTCYSKSLTEEITVRFANIKLIVNDQVVQTKAEPFVYEGNVYAPVATVANMLGIKQEWDNGTPAVRFYNQDHYDGNTQRIGLGGSVYLTSVKTDSGNYTLVDQGKTIPVPKHNGQLGGLTSTLISQSFTSISGKEREFLMLDRELDGSAVHLNLLEYDGEKINQIAKADLFPDRGIKSFDRGPIDIMLHGTKIYINRYSSRAPEQALISTEVMELKGDQFQITHSLTSAK